MGRASKKGITEGGKIKFLVKTKMYLERRILITDNHLDTLILDAIEFFGKDYCKEFSMKNLDLSFEDWENWFVEEKLEFFHQLFQMETDKREIRKISFYR